MSDTDASIDCAALLAEIRDMRDSQPTRHRAPPVVAALRSKMLLYRDHCDRLGGSYDIILLDHQYGQRTLPETVTSLREFLRESNIPDRTLCAAYGLLATLTWRQVTYAENAEYREKAVQAAQRGNLHVHELTLLVNWTFCLLSLDLNVEADTMSRRALDAQARLLPEESNSPPAREANGRLLTHQAKLLLRRLRSRTSLDPEKDLREANVLYESAVQLDLEHEHRRVNALIEWAHELLMVARQTNRQVANEARTLLDRASRGLDAHACDYCPAYFYFVRALATDTEASTAFPVDRGRAIEMWRAAVSDLQNSITAYSRVEHWASRDPEELLAQVQERLSMEERPRRVFLSHAGVNKELVRDFKKTLESVGLEPWLDEDAMSAGVELERGLLQGFKDSCAAVFFVTPQFVDENYIATEVNYAIAEKRRKNAPFAIITLVFVDEDGKAGDVPDLLRPYVWKKPKTLLEGFREILRALPLALGTPAWRT